MRLTDYELHTIRTTFHEYFGLADHLWLFGSRANDTQRGGDIDLYIETNEIDTDKAVLSKLKLASKLWQLLNEQKVDIVMNQLNGKIDLPIYDIAKKTGVQII